MTPNSESTPVQNAIESTMLGALNFPALVFDIKTLLVTESNQYFNNEQNLLVFDAFNKYDYNFVNLKVVKEIISKLDTGLNYVEEKQVNTKNKIYNYTIHANLLPGEMSVFMYINLMTDHPPKEFYKIREKPNYLKELIQNLAEGVGQINDNYIITFCNQSFASIFGKKPNEMTGENFLQFVDNQNRVIIKEELKVNFLKMNSSFELNLNSLNQQEKFILVRAIPKFNNNNHYTGSLLLLSDITERLSIEHDLMLTKNKVQETDHLKAAFLANVPHEIRTPMNSIMGFASILKRSGLSMKKRHQYLDIIISHGNKLMEILNDIIDLTIIEENQVNLILTPCNLNSIFAEAFRKNSLALKNLNKPVKIQYHHYISDDKSVIITDEGRVKQILSNLLNNSVKFTEEGTIDLGYRLEDKDTVVCYVRDTGIGIPPEIHQTIFERFRQADDSFTRNYGGTGLGLTICQGLIKLLGGRIWVESDGKHGTTFYFTLPYYPVKESKNKSRSKKTDQSNEKLEEKKIVLVENTQITP